MVSIIWTENALEDIDNIAAFISRDSEFYAEQFVKKIFDSTLKLEKYPEIGTPVRELPHTDFRQILFKKYRIIYKFDTINVSIITVHHSARLLKNNDTLKGFFD